MSILVLGAAPLSAEIFFDHRLVIVAHGGAFHLPPPDNRSFEVWAVAAANGFSPAELLEEGGMNQLVTNGPYERLLLRDSLAVTSKSLRSAVDFSHLAGELEDLTYRDIFFLLLRWFSLREILGLVEWPPDTKPWHLRGIRKLMSLRRLLSGRGTKLSTGVLAILVALREAESGEKIVVAGVELIRTTYAYSYPGDSVGSNREEMEGHKGHVEADWKVLGRICSRKAPEQLHFVSESIQAQVLAEYSSEIRQRPRPWRKSRRKLDRLTPKNSRSQNTSMGFH